MAKQEKPHPFLNIDVVIGLLTFEVATDPNDGDRAVRYYVNAYRNKASIDDCQPTHSVEVGREDFLAMLEIAKAGVSVGRSSLHLSDDEEDAAP